MHADAVVFIHQFTLDSRMWDDQFYEFARTHRVLRYDARGFGRSGSIGGIYSPRDDLRALLDHLSIARTHLVGLSMGARYAIDFALVYPQRVRSLVLADPAVSGIAFSPSFVREFERSVTAGQADRLSDAKRYWLASSIFSGTRERTDVMARVRTMVNDYSGWHFAHTDPATPLSPIAARRLSQVRSPALIVLGERSHSDAFAMAAQLYREVPSVRRLVIKDAGHLVNMESPAQFNRAVAEFFASSAVGRAPENVSASSPAPCLDPKTKQPTSC
jgi:3-oxoadipate enol-lactonase